MNLTYRYLPSMLERIEKNKPKSWSRGKRGEIRRQLDVMCDRMMAEFQLEAENTNRRVTNNDEENLF